MYKHKLTQRFTRFVIYKIKDKNEEGKYLIEQWNVNEGDAVSPDRWVKEDEISPIVPDSPDSSGFSWILLKFLGESVKSEVCKCIS